MKLLDKVREMREVGDFVATTAEMDALLGILSNFQVGDANRFDFLLNGYGSWIGSLLTEEDKNMLCRYRDIAHLMEDDHAT